ncbi:MAG: trypsin-like peptidase domain-containing protein [Alicyclobacillus sp.]|nr:trypsin-like peptidase domain-containing protein [Alicyclobacillus sp.]
MTFSPKKRDLGQRATWPRWATTALAAVFGSGVTAAAFVLAIAPRLTTPDAAVSSNSAVQTASNNVGGAASIDTSAIQGVASTSENSLATNVTKVFKAVEPSVVAVVNYANVSNYFTQQTQLQEYGVGSGVLFQKDANYAYIVTNNHVVEGAAKLEVVLYTGKHITAKLVGADPYTDLAVIKIPVAQVKNVTPAQFVNSDTIQVGQLAIAIGTPMGLDFAESVTSGIVSATQRLMPVEEPQTQQTLDYQNVIQTDAAINPGNSGGPLLDADGRVMGINSSKIDATGFEGMGFAIPSNEVRTVVQQIMSTGKVEHPALGISAYSLATLPQQIWPNVPVDYGVYVAKVTSANAQAGGLKAGDVIVAVNGKTIQDEADLRTALFSLKPGTTVTLKVYRNSTALTLKVKLGTMDVSGDGNTTFPSSGN